MRCWYTLLLLLVVELSSQSRGAPLADPGAPQAPSIFQQIDNLPWMTSPAIGYIGSVAQFSLNGNLHFLDAASTSRFLELQGNPPARGEYALTSRTHGGWFAIFQFEQTGYVRDDEKLDPDELLKALRQQNEEGIAERQRLKLSVLRLEGWAVLPHYDLETRQLEWGTRLLDDNGTVTVNYRVRILGRTGVINGVLVTDPTDLNNDLQEFRIALKNLSFVPGERYSEFRKGDKTAEYGLAALVVGGAAAAATSTGLMKGLGKIVFVAAIAVIAAVRKFFTQLLGFFKKMFGKKAL